MFLTSLQQEIAQLREITLLMRTFTFRYVVQQTSKEELQVKMELEVTLNLNEQHSQILS
jgi:hypothetical protein